MPKKKKGLKFTSKLDANKAKKPALVVDEAPLRVVEEEKVAEQPPPAVQSFNFDGFGDFGDQPSQ